MIINPVSSARVAGNVPNMKLNSFSLEATAKAFEALASNLYSDKIGSIVRELASNAYDAHVENGNPQEPFSVHLPTADAPYFEIRDYGVGMSPETVNNIYFTFFKSTKEHTNDLIGAFGLGSKSPFAYVDMFNVTSIHGGVKSVYAITKDSSGTPCYTCLGSEPTDERTGVAVNFPVNERDCYEFETALRDQLMGFAVKPLVNKNVEWNTTLLPALEKYDIAFAVTEGSGILSGQIWIPINNFYDLLHNTTAQLKNTDFKEYLTGVWRTNVAMRVPIGAVDLALSREKIAETPKTSKALAEIFYEKFTAMITSFAEDWDKLTAVEQVNLVNTNRVAKRFVITKKLPFKFPFIGLSGDRFVFRSVGSISLLNRNYYVDKYVSGIFEIGIHADLVYLFTNGYKSSFLDKVNLFNIGKSVEATRHNAIVIGGELDPIDMKNLKEIFELQIIDLRTIKATPKNATRRARGIGYKVGIGNFIAEHVHYGLRTSIDTLPTLSPGKNGIYLVRSLSEMPSFSSYPGHSFYDICSNLINSLNVEHAVWINPENVDQIVNESNWINFHSIYEEYVSNLAKHPYVLKHFKIINSIRVNLVKLKLSLAEISLVDPPFTDNVKSLIVYLNEKTEKMKAKNIFYRVTGELAPRLFTYNNYGKKIKDMCENPLLMDIVNRFLSKQSKQILTEHLINDLKKYDLPKRPKV